MCSVELRGREKRRRWDGTAAAGATGRMMAGNEAMNGWRGGGGGIRSTATEAIAAIAERTRVSERKTSEIESERERERESRGEEELGWTGGPPRHRRVRHVL